MKLEGIVPSATASMSTLTPADAVIAVIHSESASSSESDMSNGGIEADTEESMTSEEEPDKPAGATSENKELAKDKWIAVKGQQQQASSSSLDT